MTDYSAIKTMSEAEVLAELERREPARLRHDNAKLRALVEELAEALHAFLRAPSIGSSGPGSISIEVQEFNIRSARAALAKAKGDAP